MSVVASLRFTPSSADRRFFVSVSKKSYGRAVDRNKLKRRGRAIIRPNLEKFPTGSYVLFLKKGALEITFKELEKEITELFRKVK